jgi:hypothetical protein
VCVRERETEEYVYVLTRMPVCKHAREGERETEEYVYVLTRMYVTKRPVWSGGVVRVWRMVCSRYACIGLSRNFGRSWYVACWGFA